MIKAEILADSVNALSGDRITTLKVVFPRIVLAELNTHRMLSKNSASSRAIPFKKMVKMVEENPFVPIAFQKEHKGMQGSEYFTDDEFITLDTGGEWAGGVTTHFKADELLRSEWIAGSKSFIKEAKRLNSLGVTKQLCNRQLETYMWHTVILTGTEFSNFFKLRCPVYEFDLDNLEQYRKKCPEKSSE
jgi:hypothetical protein